MDEIVSAIAVKFHIEIIELESDDFALSGLDVPGTHEAVWVVAGVVGRGDVQVLRGLVISTTRL